MGSRWRTGVPVAQDSDKGVADSPGTWPDSDGPAMLESNVVRPPIRLLAADIDGTLLNPSVSDFRGWIWQPCAAPTRRASRSYW